MAECTSGCESELFHALEVWFIPAGASILSGGLQILCCPGPWARAPGVAYPAVLKLIGASLDVYSLEHWYIFN